MRILAVDDEIDQLKQLERAIKEACPEADIHSYNKAREALDFATNNPCDIALLDIQMPVMNGVILAMKLKEMKPDINVIFCTAYSEYSMEAHKLHCSGYLMKPIETKEVKNELDCLRYPVSIPKVKAYIQTFGNFDLFCNGEPVIFTRSKCKEILAYLVNRQGTSATSAEIAAIIWEDGDYGFSRQRQYQTLISELLKTLKQVGLEDIIIKRKRSLMLDKTKVECDFYEVLDGDVAKINRYTGSYMSSYSWAEFTAAKLEQLLTKQK